MPLKRCAPPRRSAGSFAHSDDVLSRAAASSAAASSAATSSFVVAAAAEAEAAVRYVHENFERADH